MLTHGVVNVLQQYFMITLGYYPRRFGKKEKKSDVINMGSDVAH